MSHAIGEVIRAETRERIGWFEYNGTSDVVDCTIIRPTQEAIWEHWRRGGSGDHADCAESVPVLLYTSYGDGRWWEGKACLTHGEIIDGFSDDEAWYACPLCGGRDTLAPSAATEHLGHGRGHPTHLPPDCPYADEEVG